MNTNKLLEVIAFLRSGVKKDDKEVALTVALPYAIPVPTHDCEEYGPYFNALYPKACELVSQINEEHLVDVSEICEGVKELFFYRMKSFQCPVLETPKILEDLTPEEVLEIQGLIRLFKTEF